MPLSLLHRRPRYPTALAAAVLAVGLLAVLPAATASAHAQLASTAPADGSRVASPTSVTLTFAEDVLAAGNGNRIVVTGPDGPVPGTLSVHGAVVATTFPAPLPPGQYLVA